MKIIRVFPREIKGWTPTDEYAFVGSPPLIRPLADIVHVSCTFTWDRTKAVELARAWGQYYPVILGGPAIGVEWLFSTGHHLPPAPSPIQPFVPGRYIAKGVTFTTRGCNCNCSWCLVPKREGKLKVIQDFAPGHIIQDNNFLQAPAEHRRRVYQMLGKERHSAIFSGGLEAALITDEVAEELRGLRIDTAFLAADTDSSLGPLAQAVKRLSFLRSEGEIGRRMPARKIRCYVLLGYAGESLKLGIARCERVKETGALPFAQLYQPPDGYIEYPKEWRDAQRKWCRPAAMLARGKEAE